MSGRDAAATPVAIVGAGPVGLTLALDLAWRGIDVTVVERRHAGDPPDPKCNHVAARTMEVFRRLGLAKRIRDAGLPPDYPHDAAYRTTFVGRELTRVKIPCRRDRFTDRSGVDAHWPTPELPHRINQLFLEPILYAAAVATPRIHVVSRTEVETITQDVAGVTLDLRRRDDGTTQRLHATYLVGCDGARSTIRRAIGARLEGDAVIQRVQATFIHAPDLLGRQTTPPSWMSISVNPRRSGNVIAIDGSERWMIFNYLRPDEDFGDVDRDRGIRDILGVGADFAYTIISNEDWIGRRLIADRFRSGRVFLAGDAAHIWVPYAGYGMNAGIADAMNLSWLLGAHLAGFAPAAILDAYEAERWPITAQVSHFAMNHAEREIRRRGTIPPEIEDDTPAGAYARAAAGRLAYEINAPQYAAAGLNFGYFYDRSPLIAYDGAAHPAYTMSTFTASSVPGCRAPHVWLLDGRSLYDALGPWFTLLRRDPGIDTSAMLAAADARGVPLTPIDVDLPADLYPAALTLVRPDQHVAWRGDSCPADPARLIDRIRGAA